MIDAARYSALETLRDGRRVEIRAIRADDRAALLAALGNTSAQSRFRRFFAVRSEFTENEISYFVDVDFQNHVALVAAVDEPAGPAIVGGARYIVTEPGRAELAFAVVDDYQGQGLGQALMRHLGMLAGAAGLRELVADVLPDNMPMLRVFERSGFPLSIQRESGVVHVGLRLSGRRA